MRSGKTLPAKAVLDDMISEWTLQDNGPEKDELIAILIRLKDQIEKKEFEAVENLREGGGKKILDFT